MENCRNNPFFSSGACREVSVAIKTNASVNSSSAHPPPRPPRATAGHLLTLLVPGVGLLQFYRGPGLGICDPRAFDTRVFESAMDEFSGKDEAFVEQ